MNFHTAEAGPELDVEIAKILGLAAKIVEGSGCCVPCDQLSAIFPEYRETFSVDGVPLHRFRPSTYWSNTFAAAMKLNFFMQVMIWQDCREPFDFIVDYGRLGPKVGPCPSTFVRAPTLELAICRGIGVCHWRDGVTYGASKVPVKKTDGEKREAEVVVEPVEKVERISEGGIVLP